jgi:hypothetical protein
VLCSPWGIQPFLHQHLLPTHFPPSPPAPTLTDHQWVRYSPMGHAFDGGRLDDAKTLSRLAEFESLINSDIDSDAAYSTNFLKSCKYLIILALYIKTFLIFNSEQLQSVSLAIPQFQFRVAEISFYIDIPCRF